MTRQDFDFYFGQLTDAFSVTQADKKAGIYYQELEHISRDLFAQTTSKILKTFAKFPTIADLLQCSWSLQPQGNELEEAYGCPDCDGYGWVILWDHAFRGRCEHGRKLSDKIAFAPVTEQERIKAYRVYKGLDEQ